MNNIINNLNLIIKERNLEKNSPLEILKDLTIGISGQYLINYITQQVKIDPFIGISTKFVVKELQKIKEILQEYNISIIVVFEGLISNDLMTLLITNQSQILNPYNDSYELRQFYNVENYEQFNFNIFMQQAMSYLTKYLPQKSLEQKPYILKQYFDPEDNSQEITSISTMETDIFLFDFNQSNTPKNEFASFIQVISSYTKTCRSISNSRKNSETLPNEGQNNKSQPLGSPNSLRKRISEEFSNLRADKFSNIQRNNSQEFDMISQKKPKKAQFIYLTAKLNFLACIEYIIPEQLKAKVIAKAVKSIKNNQLCSNLEDEEEQDILIFFQIIQSNQNYIMMQPFKDPEQLKDSKEIDKKYLNGLKYYNVNNISDQKQKHIILISRIFSFISIDYSEWNQNLYSYDQIQFQQIIQQTQKYMQNAFEIILISLFMKIQDKSLVQEFLKCKDYMPFRKVHNAGLGVLVSLILTGKLTLKETQKHYPDINKSLQKGILLWNSIKTVFQSSSWKDDAQAKNLSTDFQIADNIIKQHLTI